MAFFFWHCMINHPDTLVLKQKENWTLKPKPFPSQADRPAPPPPPPLPQHGSWVRHSIKMITGESPRWLALRRKHSQCYPTSCCDSVSDLGGDNTHTRTHTTRKHEEGAAEVKELNDKSILKHGRFILHSPNPWICGFPAILSLIYDWAGNSGLLLIPDDDFINLSLNQLFSPIKNFLCSENPCSVVWLFTFRPFLWSSAAVFSSWKYPPSCPPSWRCSDDREDVLTRSTRIKLQRSSSWKITNIILYWRYSECADTQIGLWEDRCCSRNSGQHSLALLNPTQVLSLRASTSHSCTFHSQFC